MKILIPLSLVFMCFGPVNAFSQQFATDQDISNLENRLQQMENGNLLLPDASADLEGDILNDLRNSEQNHLDAIAQLREIANALEEIKSKLQSGNEIVQHLAQIVDNYRRYREAKKNLATQCFNLKYDADRLKRNGNPTWTRFQRRVDSCMDKISKNDRTASAYKRIFDTIKQKVNQVEETLGVLETERSEQLAEENFYRAERDLTESTSHGYSISSEFLQVVR